MLCLTTWSPPLLDQPPPGMPKITVILIQGYAAIQGYTAVLCDSLMQL